MSSIILADAVEQLYAGHDLPVRFDKVQPNRDGQYLAGTLPWIISRLRIPNTVGRSMAGTAQAARVRLSTTITAGTHTGVRIMYDQLRPVLEGARLDAQGWLTSPVRELNATDIIEDETITLTETDAHPVYSVVEWEFTAARQ